MTGGGRLVEGYLLNSFIMNSTKGDNFIRKRMKQNKKNIHPKQMETHTHIHTKVSKKRGWVGR